jgi:hypothetical protein
VTGRLIPWRVKVADSVIDHAVVPALCVNDEELETQAALSGHVLTQLTGVAAARTSAPAGWCRC